MYNIYYTIRLGNEREAGRMKASEMIQKWEIELGAKDGQDALVVPRASSLPVGDIQIIKAHKPEIIAELKKQNQARIAAQPRQLERGATNNEKHYESLVKNGMCPKCKNWCYGSCRK